MKVITRITQSISKVSKHTILKVQFLSTNSILDPPKKSVKLKTITIWIRLLKLNFWTKKFTNVKGTSKNHKFFSPRIFFSTFSLRKSRPERSPFTLFSVDDEKPSPTKFAGPLSGLSVSGLIAGIFLGLSGLFIGLACVISALHRIEEGHVGVYYKFGALMEVKSPPGVHWMQPFVTQVASIRLEIGG